MWLDNMGSQPFITWPTKSLILSNLRLMDTHHVPTGRGGEHHPKSVSNCSKKIVCMYFATKIGETANIRNLST